MTRIVWPVSFWRSSEASDVVPSGWKITGADTYTIWNTDNSGKYIGHIESVSGSNPAIVSAENVFHQDLNGDGTIGAVTGPAASVSTIV